MGRRVQGVLAGSIWLSVLWLSPAAAQSPPVVESVPAASHPAVPPGWKATCLQGPYTGAPSPTCPVLKYNEHTYWAWSDANNGMAMAIVAYDRAGTAVREWTKRGARYVWRIQVNPANQTVAFVGQSNHAISFTWDELFVPAPGPGALSFVNVGAPAVNCVFAANCAVTVTDSVGTIPVPPDVSGTARLQTRTFVGAAGSPGAGQTAYLYRVDLTQAVSGGEAPCVTDLTVDFGNVSKLPYAGGGLPYDVFVITQGGLGSIGLFDVVRTGSSVTFTFAQPVCAGTTPGAGRSTYFIGAASSSPPKAVKAKVGWPGLLPLDVDARAPNH